MGTRILTTGSGSFADVAIATDALNASLSLSGVVAVRDAVLVHGDAGGADRLLAGVAERLGMTTEAHPVQWGIHTAECPATDRQNEACMYAVHRQNAEMVAAGADVVIAFPTHGLQLAPGENPANTSRGTWDCASKAKDAGLATLVVWGKHLFPFGDRGLELLRRDAARKNITLGAAGEMPIMEAWLPY